MFILTEQTPNPEAMKFSPHVRLTNGPPRTFRRATFAPEQSALAAGLFALADVAAVYVAADFVTVTLAPGGQPWAELRLPAIAAIADHLDSGAPAIADEAVGDAGAPASAAATDRDLIEEIEGVLSHWVRPGVARDGGDILIDLFDAATGTLWIRMQGACGGCPSSRQTLKATVERMVRRYVPEVLRVEDAGDDQPAASAAGRLKGWLARLPVASGPPRRPVFTQGGRPISQGQGAGSGDARSKDQ
jgi:Fe-S cluster biogenesis protein NfuA